MRRLFGLVVLGSALALAGCGSGEHTVVVMETSMGTIKMELFDDDAPVTVKNFLKYVDDKYYDGTIFHRVMPGFMIQAGGMTEGLKLKTSRAPIKNESYNGLSNKRGTVAMARTSAPDSAADQFFINVADNSRLDRDRADDKVGYCVFGKVIEGMDVVDKIAAVKTANLGGHEAVPEEPIFIKSIRRATPK
jgi:cyclophilin family peptidyl-prolyl cis-trans isomerase